MSSACCHSVEKQKTNIIDRLDDFLSSLRITILSGISLAVSLTLMLIGVEMPELNLGGVVIPVDTAWIAVLLSGFPLLYAALWRLIYSKGILKVSSSLLISIAMISAIAIGHLFAAGQVAFIMAIGAVLQDKTIARARKGISSLIGLVPEMGRVIKDGVEEMVSIESIVKGDVLRVLPGEAIPIDGEIISGDTSIDQSIITGESLPIDKSVGDEVYCGTINRFGSVDIRALKVGEDSSLKKLIRLVEEAEDNKAPTQLIVDKWAAWLVPLTLIIALATYFISGDIIRAVTVAIVFCPCALALATPTSIMAAIGQATKHGVIIKSGRALEDMGKVDIIAFDKTGTLTHGNLVVSDVVTFYKDTIGENDFLSLVASAESHSEHPLGKAVVAYAKSQGVEILPIEDFKMIPGKGISAMLDGKRILCGNQTFLEEHNIAIDNSTFTQLQSDGKAIILVSQDDTFIGIVALSDTLRDTAQGMVSELKQNNARTVLLTGDNKQTAGYFAQKAGIDSVFAELLPAQKVEQVKALQSEGKNVCMIGDGVNDAPALKTANVGVAMGSMGSDIAIEAADIALIGDDIAKVPYLKRLSDATVKNISINIYISIIFNIAAITLSIMGVLNPITGALAHNASSIAVVLNAALFYDRKFKGV